MSCSCRYYHEITMEEEKPPLAIGFALSLQSKNKLRDAFGRLVCKEPQSCRLPQISLCFAFIIAIACETNEVDDGAILQGQFVGSTSWISFVAQVPN